MIPHYFSNFGSLKSTETCQSVRREMALQVDFSNFGSLKSTETSLSIGSEQYSFDFSNFGSLKSTETPERNRAGACHAKFQQFRLVEEH